MGKSEEEQLPSTLPPSAESSVDNAGRARCRWIGRIVRPRCFIALVLGIAVLLSAVFWLPPFIRRNPKGSGDADLSSKFEANVIASFELHVSFSELDANIQKLQYDILAEIGVPNSSVVILSLTPLAGQNWTNVVFSVLPYPTNSTLSSSGLSILKSYFVSLVVQQSTLHLTPSFFGNLSFFQVLEFPGGITIIPPQNAFLLQTVQIVFNFTLNFSIYKVQGKIGELKDQMRTGLHLAPDENLYVQLTNLLGSTMAPPTIVQTAILPAVGPPSKLRTKQLAEAVAGSPARNLGLNHTVFGRVKQIQLSSFLQHSLNSGDCSSTSCSPSPTPLSAPSPHHDDNHHHHHHHQNSKTRLTPAPSPQHSYHARPPSGCIFGFPWKVNNESNLVPAASPPVSQLPEKPTAPAAAPHLEASPLPAVYFARVRPPSKSVTLAKPPDKMLPYSSCVADFPSIQWAVAPLLYLFVHL